MVGTSVAPRDCWGWGGMGSPPFPLIPQAGRAADREVPAAAWGKGGPLSPTPSETHGTEPTLSDPSCGCLGLAGRCWAWEQGSGRADTAEGR